MAYDFTGAWDESAIAHHSDYKTFRRALSDIKSRGFRTEKLVVGVPAYAIEFVNGKNNAVKHIPYRTFIDLAKSTGQLERSNKTGQLGNMYSETTTLALKKVMMLNEQGYAGAMLFELSSDSRDPDFSLLAQLNAELRNGCQ